MNKPKPVNLQLTTIRFPITAIVSILHRISGVILFLFIPGFLWALDSSLSSAIEFDKIARCFSHPLSKLFIWGSLSALFYHLIAGCRHLLMDFGFAESLRGGRLGAIFTLILSAVVVILLGIAIW